MHFWIGCWQNLCSFQFFILSVSFMQFFIILCNSSDFLRFIFINPTFQVTITHTIQGNLRKLSEWSIWVYITASSSFRRFLTPKSAISMGCSVNIFIYFHELHENPSYFRLILRWNKCYNCEPNLLSDFILFDGWSNLWFLNQLQW